MEDEERSVPSSKGSRRTRREERIMLSSKSMPMDCRHCHLEHESAVWSFPRLSALWNLGTQEPSGMPYYGPACHGYQVRAWQA